MKAIKKPIHKFLMFTTDPIFNFFMFARGMELDTEPKRLWCLFIDKCEEYLADFIRIFAYMTSTEVFQEEQEEFIKEKIKGLRKLTKQLKKAKDHGERNFILGWITNYTNDLKDLTEFPYHMKIDSPNYEVNHETII